jgi:transcriptional regulator with XRE-family HTH domain
MSVHPADDHIGRRIAQQRKQADLTQQRLADLTGYSTSLLSQVEQGAKTATPALIAAVARTLHIDVGVLTGQPAHELLRADALDALIDPIRDALDLFDLGPSDTAARPRPANVLHVAAEDQCKMVRAGHIRQVAQVLPALIEEATAAAYLAPAGSSAEWAVLGSIYRSAYDVATKLGYQDLAAIALDRMAWAGERASDPVLVSLRQYMRSLVQMRLGKYSTGHRLIAAGQNVLQQADNLVERTAIGGQLHLGAAVLSARAGNHDQALGHLAQADLAAAATGEVPRLRWVSFGPTNAAAHRVAALAELRDYGAAVAAADSMTVPADWPASRAARHYTEVANARLWTGDKDGSLRDLQTARQLAPQQTRYDYTVRETVSALVRAQRSTPGTLQNMAAWVGV